MIFEWDLVIGVFIWLCVKKVLFLFGLDFKVFFGGIRVMFVCRSKYGIKGLIVVF